ncbi:hypothetical protein [Burkholderia multivorans]|uniref:hypothetical protein n=1 Tax=Burkholderia multivorans TaxID=87883 RepID=UPI000F4D80D1|nr:hypothetical protein [Burkholderia multivorans]MBU9121834.1 hypothetical protein [Burkholderia multivorans]
MKRIFRFAVAALAIVIGIGAQAQTFKANNLDVMGAATIPGLQYSQGSTGAITQTVQQKLRQTVNVLDFGAKGDGTTDDYPAFQAAKNAVPWGGTVIVPQPSNGQSYNLSANPDTGSKVVNWQFDAGVKFKGAGIGNASTGSGTFTSTITNPWLVTSGPYYKNWLGALRSPLGGASLGWTWECGQDDGTGYPLTFTGTLTNGQSKISNVSSTSNLYPGLRLIATFGGIPVTGFPNVPTDQVGAVRILSVNSDGTITFFRDYVDGNQTPYIYTGSTTAGVTFQVPYRNWQACQYVGANTGTSSSPDMSMELVNYVMNIQGASGNMVEYDLNFNAPLLLPGAIPRAIFITGGGQNYTAGVGVDIQRGKGTWMTGVSVRNAQTGFMSYASQDMYFGQQSSSTDTSGNFLMLRDYAGNSLASVTKVGDATFHNLVLDQPAQNFRSIFWRSAGSNRWEFVVDNGADTGGNANENLCVNRYSDAGALIDCTLAIIRSSGQVQMKHGAAVTGDVSASGNVTVTGNVTANNGAMPAYTADGSTIAHAHVVSGAAGLSGGSVTVNFSGAAAFTSASSYVCTANNTSTTGAVRVNQTSGTSVTFSGNGSDGIAYNCIGG